MPFHYNFDVRALHYQMHVGYCHITDWTLSERHLTLGESDAAVSGL